MRRKLMEIVSVGRNSAGEVLKLTALKAGQLLKELEPAIYSSGSQLTTTDWQENLTLEASKTREAKEINVSAGGSSVLLPTANVVASAAISSVSASYGARWPGVTTFLSRGFHTTSANWDSRGVISEESGVLFDVDNADVEIGGRAVTSYRATDIRSRFTTGINDFRELRLSDEYVDKSEIVYAFEYSGSKVCANTFPRRFLKTTNLNTLEEFYRIEVDEMGIPLPLEARQNPALFAGGEVVVDGTARLLESLKIAAHPEIMGKLGTVPVISLDLKGVSGDSYENALVTMKAAMHFAWDKHDYLANSDKLKPDQLELVARYTDSIRYEDLTESQVKLGLGMLSKLLHTHFGAQAIVLVDEYDIAINKAYRNLKTDTDDADRIIGLHRDMFGNVLKGNEHLYKGLVTGILRIAKANIFSGLNNLGEYNMGDRKFAGLYGFTQEEFDELVVRFGIPSALAADLKDWYNGYDVLGAEIYNPWSVVKALDSFNACRHVVDIDRVRKEVLQNYWQESGAFNFITPLFRHPDVKDAFTELAAGRTIEFEITKQISVDNFMALREMLGSASTYEMTPLGKDILYSYLFAAGYLTPNGREGYYRAPNKETMDEFTKQLVTYHKVKYKLGTPLFNKLTD